MKTKLSESKRESTEKGKLQTKGEVDNEVDNEVQENQENIFTTPSPRRTSLRERRRPNTEELEDLEDQENIFRSPSPSPRSSSQKEKGEQLRRKNRLERNKEIDELKQKLSESNELNDKKDDKIKELEAENEQIINKNKQLEKKLENCDNYLPIVYKNMTSNGRREWRDGFMVASSELERGTISRLRKNTGLNFSIPAVNNEQEKSSLKTKIEEFAMENTIEVPDKRKVKQGIRYRCSSKRCLYENFETQHPNLCNYPTFCLYWPKNFIKPKPSDLGTCMCIICQNTELKSDALKNLIGLDHCLERIIDNGRRMDFTDENEFKETLEKIVEDKNESIVPYLRWEKIKQTEINKNTGRAKSDRIMRKSNTERADTLAQSLLEEFDEYKAHLERVSEMYMEQKAMKVESEQNDDMAVVHMDWAEQHKLSEIKEVQSAYFNGRWAYDMQIMFIYTKEDSHGAASISESPDHKAEAVHAAIKPEIEKLVRNGKSTIVMVSDSPTSQYRNAKNVYLMRRLAVELKICIRLLFTESGHGKSACDGVGENIKTQVEEIVLQNHGENSIQSIHSVLDVKKIIEDKTRLTYDISIHTEEDIKEVRDSLPKLGPLVGALKIHEILISPDGLVKKKTCHQIASIKMLR